MRLKADKKYMHLVDKDEKNKPPAIVKYDPTVLEQTKKENEDDLPPEEEDMAKYVNSTLQTGSYEPFEGSDGNLVEGDLLVVGYNNVNDSFQVQDNRGLLHDIPARQSSTDAGKSVNTVDINKL